MKKYILLTLMALVPGLAGAQAVLVDGIYYNLDLEEKTAWVTSGNEDASCYSGDLVIPSSIEYEDVAYGVIGIGDHVFDGCSNLISITIPSSVTAIGHNAFDPQALYITDLSAWCSILFGDGGDADYPVPAFASTPLYLNGEPITNLIIPEDVTEVNAYAFYNCESLSTIFLPDGVKSIGAYAFFGCKDVYDVSAGRGLSYIAYNALSNLFSLDRFVIKAENPPVVSLPSFSGTNKWCKLYVPYGCKTAYEQAVDGNAHYWKYFYSIDEFYGPSEGLYYAIVDSTKTASVLTTDFFAATHPVEVIFPSAVEIGGNTFTVTTISSRAFENCKSLTSVTIPSSLTAIREEAFHGCGALERIDISDIAGWCNIKLGERGGSDFMSGYAFDATPLYLNGEPIEELVIPEGVVQVPDLAFYNCHSLKSVILPNSVSRIEMEAFDYCDNLTFMKVGSGLSFINFTRLSSRTLILNQQNPPFLESPVNSIEDKYVPYGSKVYYDSYYEMDRPSWGKNTKEFYASPEGIYYGLELEKQTVKVITTDYFDVTDLTEVKIPETIECDGVTYTVTGIGHKAFEINRCMTSIILPSTVISVDDFAFNKCAGLTEMYCYAEEVPTASETAFKGSNVGDAILYVPATSVDNYKASSPWNTFKEICPITTVIEHLDRISENNDEQQEFFRLDGQRVNDARLLPSGSIVVVKKDEMFKKVLIK